MEMIMKGKPPLGLIPRHFWLRDRTIECVRALDQLESLDDWEMYRKHASQLAEELTYAVTEWEKYYK
jgi:hypothetical protein